MQIQSNPSHFKSIFSQGQLHNVWVELKVVEGLAIFSYSPFIHDILVRSLHTFSGNIYHYTQLFSSKLSTLVKNVSAPTSEM